jgi:hypothetical protein
MVKTKYKLGDKIYKYDYDSNSIEELMISGVNINTICDNTLTKGIDKSNTFTDIKYRLANKNYINIFSDVAEHEINQKYFFDSEEKLKEHLLKCYKEQNKLQ